MLEYSTTGPPPQSAVLPRYPMTYIRSHHNALPAPATAHAVRARRPVGDSDPAPSGSRKRNGGSRRQDSQVLEKGKEKK